MSTALSVGSFDKENHENLSRPNQHPSSTRKNPKKDPSYKVSMIPPVDPRSFLISSPKVSKPSITQEYYQSYSPVPVTTTTKAFPSFTSPSPQKTEYLPLAIEDEEELLVLQRLEEELQQHQTKNYGFTAFIIVNIIFMIIVISLIYMMHTTPSTLGKSDKRNQVGGGFTVEVDSLTNRYFVIDNDPLPNFPFTTTQKTNTNDPSTATNRVILADGLFHRNLNNNGWNYLSIETMDLRSFAIKLNTTKGTKQLTENEQLATIRQQYMKNMKALGYLEGYLTCNEIKQYYENFYADSFGNVTVTKDAVDFLLLNYQWMELQSEQYYSFSNYWLVVKGLLSQLNGLVQGARDGCSTKDHDYIINGPIDLTKSSSNSNKKSSKPILEGAAGTNQGSFKSILSDAEFAKAENHYNDAFLPSMHKRPELIHFLLVNANGDLFQIKQKFDIIGRNPISASNDDLDRQDDDDDKVDENATTNSTDSTTLSAETTTLFSEKIVRRRMEVMNSILPEAPLSKNEKVHLRKSKRNPKLIENRRKLAAKLEQVINNNHDSHRSQATKKKNRHHDHCSAVIKLLPNASDIVFGHNTWDDFTNAAPRVFKHYTYTLLQESKPATKFDVYFSSSPGLLGSVDDFYIVHGNGHLAVLETSLDINNDQLLNIVSPQTMLYWARASVANQLAHSGKSWAQIFSMHHSGTYANQWMVLDYQKFTPGSPPDSHFLTILEEVPGYIHYEDMTKKFNADGYWASYNNPYFDDIARITGQYDLCQKDSINCYDTDPRAEIFRTNHQRVFNVTDLKYLMTYNDYQHDPYSRGDPCNAISCRSDLDEDVRYRSPFGAVDSKISSVILSSKTDYAKDKPTIYIQFGPTHTQQKPFCWSEYETKLEQDIQSYNQQNPDHPILSIPKYTHNGHPDCFNYTWEKLPPVVTV